MPGSYYDRITEALASLPPSLSCESSLVTPSPIAVMQNHSSFTMLLLNPGWQPQPHQIIIEDPEEFVPLVAAYDAIQGTDYSAYARAAVVHEGQHAIAARQLGARSIAFGLQLKRLPQHPENTDTTKSVDFNAFCISTDFVVSKLGLALIKAHPETFLEADTDAIRTMGYQSGIQEVGALAVAYNERHSDPLPVPLSYIAEDPDMVSYYACG